MHNLSKSDISEFIAPYIGKVVREVRRGHGSAIFLEVEDLTIMIEWSWRIEKGKEIYFGSWSDDSDISSKLARLNGLIVSGVTFQARLPEIQVELSGDIWVCSFSTVEGDPEWAMVTPQRTLISQKGHLTFE